MPLDAMPLLLATGAATGLLAGLVGIGGGIVVVPVLLGLYAAQGVPGPVALPLAVGTAQATVAAAALSAAFAHGRAGNIDRHLLAAWLPWALAGAVAGALLAPLAPTPPLAGFFALVAAVLAVRLLVPGGTGRPMDPLTGWRRRGPPSAIGAIAGALGVGVGTLAVPILAAMRQPLAGAVGTTAPITAAVGAVGAARFWIATPAAGAPAHAVGLVDPYAGGVVALAAAVAAPLGRWLSGRASPAVLRRVLVIVLALV
ncbi:MAG: sulfite exporter TauE/SafE family protein, partial [Rhodospirillales bacterium]|nr:sulfite exporter TauE/SafE family protein [Rhodospirillales bacterium]